MGRGAEEFYAEADTYTIRELRANVENEGQVEAYAAKVRHLRNRYESLLTDILACDLSATEIQARRALLEEEENRLFKETAPHTSNEAVKMAEKALNQKQDSTTTMLELNTHLPKHLQLSEDLIKNAISEY